MQFISFITFVIVVTYMTCVKWKRNGEAVVSIRGSACLSPVLLDAYQTVLLLGRAQQKLLTMSAYDLRLPHEPWFILYTKLKSK
jgi:hypothetical protein